MGLPGRPPVLHPVAKERFINIARMEQDDAQAIHVKHVGVYMEAAANRRVSKRTSMRALKTMAAEGDVTVMRSRNVERGHILALSHENHEKWVSIVSELREQQPILWDQPVRIVNIDESAVETRPQQNRKEKAISVNVNEDGSFEQPVTTESCCKLGYDPIRL